MIDSLGRKPVFLICMFVAAVSCITTIFQVDFLAFKLSYLLTKCTVAGAFTLVRCKSVLPPQDVLLLTSIVRVYTAELYPTALRYKAINTCKSVAAFAAIFSPLLTLLPLKAKELGMVW